MKAINSLVKDATIYSKKRKEQLWTVENIRRVIVRFPLVLLGILLTVKVLKFILAYKTIVLSIGVISSALYFERNNRIKYGDKGSVSEVDHEETIKFLSELLFKVIDVNYEKIFGIGDLINSDKIISDIPLIKDKGNFVYNFEIPVYKRVDTTSFKQVLQKSINRTLTDGDVMGISKYSLDKGGIKPSIGVYRIEEYGNYLTISLVMRNNDLKNNFKKVDELYHRKDSKNIKDEDF